MPWPCPVPTSPRPAPLPCGFQIGHRALADQGPFEPGQGPVEGVRLHPGRLVERGDPCVADQHVSRPETGRQGRILRPWFQDGVLRRRSRPIPPRPPVRRRRLGNGRLRDTGLFSGLNNLEGITLDPAYGTICGYTDEDLEAGFTPELEGLDRDEARRRYNSYSWLGERKVCNPFDMLRPFRREVEDLPLRERMAANDLAWVGEDGRSRGRADMALRFDGRVYLFELKVADRGPEGAALA